MNVLVTGGTGYIGSHSCVELLEAGKGGLCVSEVHGEIKGLKIEDVLSHKRATDYDIYEDAMKLR